MRLLNVDTLNLEDFDENDVPQYAILSHRWEKEEVTFKDMECGTAKQKMGYTKLIKACAEARNRGHAHIWIDTCCIDKSSSAELSEAINSMFRWYQSATECLAYLFDVGQFLDLGNSQWFLRGWTLQELIAPPRVRFYASNWICIGEKSELAGWLEDITGIPSNVILDHSCIELESVATRMSWAAKRTTTRVEDRAYSLMGIFDVNMPLLYGEGPKAFLRLQQEIIKQSDDTSVLLWNSHCPPGATKLFAASPAEFAYLLQSPGLVTALREARTSKCARPPFALTNTGLSIELQLLPWTRRLYFAALPDLINARGWEDPAHMLESQCFIPLKFNPDADVFERLCIENSCIHDLSSTGSVVSETYPKPQSYLGRLKFDEGAKGTYGESDYQFSYTHDLVLRRITIATQPLAASSSNHLQHACRLRMESYLVSRYENGYETLAKDRTSECLFSSRFGVNHIFGAVHTRLFTHIGRWSIYLAFDADFYPIVLLSDSNEIKSLYSSNGTRMYIDWRTLRDEHPDQCHVYHLKTITRVSVANENFFILTKTEDASLGALILELIVRYNDEAEQLLQHAPRGRAGSPSLDR